MIWTLLPGANEGKPDPYETLKQSVQIGEQKVFVYLMHYMPWLLKRVVTMPKSVMH